MSKFSIVNGTTTLASGIDVGQGINGGPGKFGRKNKRRALNTSYVFSLFRRLEYAAFQKSNSFH